MPRIIKSLQVRIKPEARCQHCVYEIGPSDTALAEAKAHIKAKPDHVVVVDVVTRSVYRLES